MKQTTRQMSWTALAIFVLAVAPAVPVAPAVFSAGASLHSPAAPAQPDGGKEQGKRKKDDLAIGDARPVMWQDPGNIAARDLFFGAGGREGAPNPNSRYTFLRRSDSGTQKKIIVKDDRGREWTVKFGLEAQPETAATRLVWAVGYHVDQDYFVRQARIEGEERYDARNVRFERRDDGYKEIGNWSWESNPFGATREMDGLKVLMALLKNWDLKTDNNKTVRRKGKERDQIIYYVSDLGATLGRTGAFLNNIPILSRVLFLSDLPPDTPAGAEKSKGNPEEFAREKFISHIEHDQVKFHAERERCKKIFKGVAVDNARWMGMLLGRLSEKQLRDAFRAGGFDEAEIASYVRTVRGRIRELQNLRDDDF